MLTNLGAALRHWRRRFSRSEWAVKRLQLARDAAPSHAPGLLLIQIDGLSRAQMEAAMARGRLPFLGRLQHRHGCRLHTFYPGLPSTTPAVQGELYYGVRAAVPAFSFLDPRADEIRSMIDPEWAKRIEGDLAAQGEGLLKGGSSWSNIYTGGALQTESHFCAASIGLGDLWRTGKVTNLLLFAALHTVSFLRLLALVPIELALSVYDALRGLAHGFRWRREFAFIFARIFICLGLRELVTFGAKVDLARGLPIIHVNFLGYDEQAHRRGPGSAFAHWTLLGIDRAIQHLHRAARRSNGRDYEVWIFSDHGQVKSQPFDQIVSEGLEGLVRRVWPGLGPEARHPVKAASPGRNRADWLGGPGRARRERRATERARLTTFEKEEFAVACLGPVGHLYCKRELAPAVMEKLVADLLAGGVPGLLRARNGQVEWQTANRTYLLPQDPSGLGGPEQQRPTLAADLAALATHRFAGDLIALGWAGDGTSLTFAPENGSHAGPSPEETQGFLLLPPASDHLIHGEFVRPSELREAALRHLGRAPAAPARARALRPALRLRVVTYNVHYCKGLDGRFAPERIARVLRHLDADIIALQELESGRERSRSEDQLEYLAANLGLSSCFCTSIEQGEERYGHAFLARGPLQATRCLHLPTGGRPRIEPRDAMAATVELHGRTVTLFGTHFGLARQERAAQIQRMLEPDLLGGDFSAHPAIFLGDLNLSPGGPLYQLLQRGWRDEAGNARFRDAQALSPNPRPCLTFPAFLPLRRLDHIFVTSHFKVIDVFAPANLLTRRASDHLPLVADLELHA